MTVKHENYFFHNRNYWKRILLGVHQMETQYFSSSAMVGFRSVEQNAYYEKFDSVFCWHAILSTLDLP